MATHGLTPYNRFNFRVYLPTGGTSQGDFNAGFQEVSALGTNINVAEYRAGNSKNNSPQKITGIHKIGDVTLKRGVVGDLTTLNSWLDAVRSGGQGRTRTVIIQLLDELRQNPVQQWTLINARPVKYTGPKLTGKGTDVAIEELVLVTERIDLG